MRARLRHQIFVPPLAKYFNVPLMKTSIASAAASHSPYWGDKQDEPMHILQQKVGKNGTYEYFATSRWWLDCGLLCSAYSPRAWSKFQKISGDSADYYEYWDLETWVDSIRKYNNIHSMKLTEEIIQKVASALMHFFDVNRMSDKKLNSNYWKLGIPKSGLSDYSLNTNFKIPNYLFSHEDYNNDNYQWADLSETSPIVAVVGFHKLSLSFGVFLFVSVLCFCL